MADQNKNVTTFGEAFKLFKLGFQKNSDKQGSDPKSLQRPFEDSPQTCNEDNDVEEPICTKKRPRYDNNYFDEQGSDSQSASNSLLLPFEDSSESEYAPPENSNKNDEQGSDCQSASNSLLLPFEDSSESRPTLEDGQISASVETSSYQYPIVCTSLMF